MPRPPSDYRVTYDKIVDLLGVGKTHKIVIGEIAEMTREPKGRVERLIDVATSIGSIEMSRSGSDVAYRVIDTFAEADAKVKAAGRQWHRSVQEKHRRPTPTFVARSLSDMSPLRKSEPKAELEVARKYRDQQMFIDTERARFAEMGLEMPAIAPAFDEQRRRELEAIVRILPYIESLERANDNLSTQNHTIRQPMGELTELRTQTRAQKEQIERLVAEKTRAADEVRKMIDQYKQEIRTLTEDRDSARAETQRLRGERALNGALNAHEINNAVDRVLHEG